MAMSKVKKKVSQRGWFLCGELGTARQRAYLREANQAACTLQDHCSGRSHAWSEYLLLCPAAILLLVSFRGFRCYSCPIRFVSFSGKGLTSSPTVALNRSGRFWISRANLKKIYRRTILALDRCITFYRQCQPANISQSREYEGKYLTCRG